MMYYTKKRIFVVFFFFWYNMKVDIIIKYAATFSHFCIGCTPSGHISDGAKENVNETLKSGFLKNSALKVGR